MSDAADGGWGHTCRGAGRESMEDTMRFAKINMTTFSVGLAVSVLGLGMLLSSPGNAKQRNRQQPVYGDQSYSGGVTGMPRDTPRGNVAGGLHLMNTAPRARGRVPTPSLPRRFRATR